MVQPTRSSPALVLPLLVVVLLLHARAALGESDSPVVNDEHGACNITSADNNWVASLHQLDSRHYTKDTTFSTKFYLKGVKNDVSFFINPCAQVLSEPVECRSERGDVIVCLRLSSWKSEPSQPTVHYLKFFQDSVYWNITSSKIELFLVDSDDLSISIRWVCDRSLDGQGALTLLPNLSDRPRFALEWRTRIVCQQPYPMTSFAASLRASKTAVTAAAGAKPEGTVHDPNKPATQKKRFSNMIKAKDQQGGGLVSTRAVALLTCGAMVAALFAYRRRKQQQKLL